MADSCTYHLSATWRALLVSISVIAVRAADAVAQGQCPPFSCGDLHNVSYPFRRPGDPPDCGDHAYELACSSGKATIRIKTGTYFVTSINYTDRSFWVVDANLDMNSSCPLTRWVVAYQVQFLEPYCGYLAMIPIGSRLFNTNPEFENASYTDVIQLIKKGFSVRFPWDVSVYTYSASWIIETCLNNSTSYFYEQLSSTSILHWIRAFFWIEVTFAKCSNYYYNPFQRVVIAISSAIGIAKLLFVCRVVLSALVVFTFLAHKYWKTRITIDAVEKFLRMQHTPISRQLLAISETSWVREDTALYTKACYSQEMCR